MMRMTYIPLALAAVFWVMVAVGLVRWFSKEPREFGYHLAGTLALTFALLAVAAMSLQA